MKAIITTIILLLTFDTMAQKRNYDTDTKSIESTISTLYEVISGGPDVARDWDRFKNLFKPEGRLIPTRKDEQGNMIIKALTPDEYIELFKSRIPNGFFERELNRKVEEYGTVVHVFSTYETKEKKEGPVTNRGINSIQLFKDKDRYYIVNIFWCPESMGYELPRKYLPKN